MKKINRVYGTNKDRFCSIVFLCISILFYLFFVFYDGVVICADSPSYIDMYTSREPFYCVFLAALRAIFGLFAGEGNTSHIRFEGMTELSVMAIITILAIVINVAVVSMVIFCQTRYTIYNMPLFYITLWILFIKNVERIIQHRFMKDRNS